jgi:hypothetical protein
MSFFKKQPKASPFVWPFSGAKNSTGMVFKDTDMGTTYASGVAVLVPNISRDEYPDLRIKAITKTRNAFRATLSNGTYLQIPAEEISVKEVDGISYYVCERCTIVRHDLGNASTWFVGCYASSVQNPEKGAVFGVDVVAESKRFDGFSVAHFDELVDDLVKAKRSPAYAPPTGLVKKPDTVVDLEKEEFVTPKIQATPKKKELEMELKEKESLVELSDEGKIDIFDGFKASNEAEALKEELVLLEQEVEIMKKRLSLRGWSPKKQVFVGSQGLEVRDDFEKARELLKLKDDLEEESRRIKEVMEEHFAKPVVKAVAVVPKPELPGFKELMLEEEKRLKEKVFPVTKRAKKLED